MSDQSRGKSKFSGGLFKRLLRLLKFFTAQIPSGRVLNFPSAQAFGRYDQFFPPEAIAHPAKANSAMIEWIILRYTKPGGVMVLITKNFIREKKIVRLDLDTIKLCEAAGFTFVERWYRKLEHPSFWRIIYAKKFHFCPQCAKVYRVRNATTDKPSLTKCPKCQAKLKPALIDVEDILVFRKPGAPMCPMCKKHELVPHPSDTLLCPECGYIKTGAEK